MYMIYDDLDEYCSIDDQEIDCKCNKDGVPLDYFSEEDDINMHDNGSDDDDILKCHDNDGQCLTAASKLQIRLNDLINRHKAPLQMYDDIVTLFNEYMSSPTSQNMSS